jgi:hypothetical protein
MDHVCAVVLDIRPRQEMLNKAAGIEIFLPSLAEKETD